MTVLLADVLLAAVAAGLALLLLVCLTLVVGLTVMLGHSYTLGVGFISGGGVYATVAEPDREIGADLPPHVT